MPNETPLWLTIMTAAFTGLLVAVLGHLALRLPLLRVKVRHELRIAWDDAVSDQAAHVESYVKVTNLRERPVTIDHVWILRRARKGEAAILSKKTRMMGAEPGWPKRAVPDHNDRYSPRATRSKRGRPRVSQ